MRPLVLRHRLVAVAVVSMSALSVTLMSLPAGSLAQDVDSSGTQISLIASPAQIEEAGNPPSPLTQTAFENLAAENLNASANNTAHTPCGRPDCPHCNPAPSKPAPSILPWKALYFDNDFSYKGKPNAPHFLGEELKNIPLFDDCCEPSGITMSYGGEVRHRYMNEDHRLRPGGPGRSTYDLLRWRQYVDMKYKDEVRVYVEMIDASIYKNELPVTGIDENRWDIQNAFFDVKVAERDSKPVYFRAGRQELLYGTPSAVSPGQQVISPLDWANTRRSTEGFRLINKGETWDLDAFAVRPVNTANPTGAAGGRSATTSVFKYDNKFDEADYSRWYSGLYTVYRGIKDQTIEPYYVWLQTDTINHDAGWADGNRHNVGLRWTATKPLKDECDQPWGVLASDVEGAYQFGNDNGKNVQAGFFTAKLGGTLSQVPWTPNLSMTYYWGSGDSNAKDGKNSTYDVLIPLNHAYWGIIDNLSGQNLNQIGMQGTVKPHAKLTCLGAMHWFDLNNNGDKVYNVAGAPVGVAGTGKNVGNELDMIATYAYNPNFDVQLGYSWFWYGPHFTGANSKIAGKTLQDATQLYLQTSLRY